MKNLYEQLTPEVKKAVKKSNEYYPLIQERFESDMKAKRHSVDLSIGDAHSIFTIAYPLVPFDLTKYFEMFKQ